jgi:hypothetical protein
MPIDSALRRLRPEDCKFEAHLCYNSEFEANLDYIVKPCLMKQNNSNKKELETWRTVILKQQVIFKPSLRYVVNPFFSSFLYIWGFTSQN